MKGLTWKKIMSLVLVAALVIGCLQLNAKKVSAGSTASVSDVTVVTNTDDPSNPTVTYSLTGENGEPTVQGTHTDIVLAIDLSGSMDGTSVASAKAAAKQFVNTLVGADAVTKDYVNIAIVKYSNNATAINLGTDSKPVYLSNDQSKLNSAIDGLTAGGGTNYDDGMEVAEAVLAGSNNAKAIVFMSDGEPTYANGTWSTANNVNASNMTVVGIVAKANDADKYDYYEYRESSNGTLYRRGVYSWYGRWYYEDWSSWEKATAVDGSKTIIGAGSEHTKVVVNAAVNEATKAKNSGITVYTVLFNSNSTAAQTALNAMSTSGKAQVTSDILTTFASIAQTIAGEIAGTDGRIEATLSKYVSYNPTETIPGISTKGSNPTILTWTIGDMNGDHVSPAIPFAVDKAAVLADYVAGTLTADENGVITVPVTTVAWLKYSKGEVPVDPVKVEKSATVQFKIGEDILKYKVVYTVNDGEGEPEVTTEPAQGWAFALKDANVTLKTAAELVENPGWYTYTAGSNKITQNEQVINVSVVRDEVTVKFREKNDNGEYVDIVDSSRQVLVGATVDTSAFTARDYTITTEDDSTVYYWQKTWNNGVTGEVQITNETTFDADYDDGHEIFTVIFRDSQGDKKYTGVAGTEIEKAPKAFVPEDTEAVDYTFNGWVSGEETVQPGDLVRITEDKIYVADITEKAQQYTVHFVDENSKPLIDDFQVDYNTTISTEKLTAANEAAKVRATEKTNAEDNKTTVYTFTDGDWDKDETAAVVAEITFVAQFTESNKQYTVTYKYYDTEATIGTPQTVDANGEVTFIDAPAREDMKFVEYGYFNENGQYVPFDESQTGLKNILEDKTVYLTYRDIQKGTFIFWQKEAGIETTEKETRTFDEDTLSLVVVPNGPAKDNKVEGNTTTKYTFDSWKTFMTNEEILERTPVEELQEADIVEGRVMRISDVNAPQAGTEEIEGVWITYAEYMEKYFRFEERNFYPTYTETTTTSNPDPDPVVTQIIILPPPVVTETPEEPTATPTEVPATPTPVEEEPIEVEEPETPEGDVELDEVETPEGAPEEEELDVEPIDTPQGDLPKTGVAPSAVFFGIGAACVVFGGAIVLKLRRKEEM